MRTLDLRRDLSFGFEATFTIPEWWTDPGFVATSDTPLKREKIKVFAEKIALVLGGTYRESLDIYGHLQYETFDGQGRASFVVTLDPGSVEVKTPPLLIAQITGALAPLFEAAELAGMVPYRQWWYGIKKGTEGQCHINLAGLTPETNPLRARPDLLAKYLIFFHNHPCLHYPFMGGDVGPGGNSMRMDEHGLDPYADGTKGVGADSLARLHQLRERLVRGEVLTPEALVGQFEGTKLAEEKYSAPSLLKYRAPLYMIEERGVESLRSPEDFRLLCELRMRILEKLLDAPVPEIRSFDPATLHGDGLSSWSLWEQFVVVARTLELYPADFRHFFDQQFPLLATVKPGAPADSAPRNFRVREGRRPRKYLGIQKRGDIVISKTIDPRYARYELETSLDGACEFRVNGKPVLTQTYTGADGRPIQGAWYDTFAETPGQVIEIALWRNGQLAETSRFNLTDVMFVGASTS
jgi:hypothetical protein